MKQAKPTYEELEARNQTLERTLKNIKDYVHVVLWASLPLTKPQIGGAMLKILKNV